MFITVCVIFCLWTLICLGLPHLNPREYHPVIFVYLFSLPIFLVLFGVLFLREEHNCASGWREVGCLFARKKATDQERTEDPK